MKTYELVVVFDGKITPAKKKTEIAGLEKIFKVLGGEVVKSEDWGIKELVYPIKKCTSGLFVIFTLNLNGEAAKNLPAKLKLEDQVIRHLLIVKGEVKNNVKKSK